MRVGSLFLACVTTVLRLPLCGLAQPSSLPHVQDFLVTSASEYEPVAALRGAERFPKGAQVLLVRDGRSAPLIPSFAATADANVAFDAKTILFAGKVSPADTWQIYELTLADRTVRRVTHSTEDAIRPMYLPAGRFIYAQRTQQGFQIVSSRLSDSKALAETEGPGTPAAFPITYTGSAVPVDVLADGRILFESGFPLGTAGVPELYLVYADGSGVESYRCDHGAASGSGRWGGHQVASGDIVFTRGSSLARFTSPLAHEQPISAPRAQYSGAITELTDGAWLLSARATDTDRYVIRRWKPGAAAMATILARTGENLVDPVLLAPRTPPHHHPSALHPWDYANLLALDARLSREGLLSGMPAAIRLESQDVDGRTHFLGTAPIEADGSFFVKAPGDRPLRFAVLDASGTVLRQEHGWVWARGGEQRICVGCHTGPERAAENRVPAVLLRSTTPVDLTQPANRASSGGNR